LQGPFPTVGYDNNKDQRGLSNTALADSLLLVDASVYMLRHPHAQEGPGQRQQWPSSSEVLQFFSKEDSGPSDRLVRRNQPGV
jgi:hypothetical protein